MTFKDFLAQSLNAPKSEAKQIAETIKSHFNLMESEDDVMSMAELIVYICGECSGEWEKGSELLKKLKNNAPVKDKEQHGTVQQKGAQLAGDIHETGSPQDNIPDELKFPA